MSQFLDMFREQMDIDICRKNHKQYAYSNYTGIPKDDAAKIYEMVIKELV